MSQHIQWHNTNTFSGGAPTPVMDTITATSRGAYSLRQIYAAATNAVRVREDGGDTLADIGFDANGDLDVTALTAHLGANNGFVHTWYDQSTFGRDITQTTNGLQPKITANASNSLYGVEYVRASSTRLASTDSTDIAQAWQFFAVAEEVGGPAAVAVIAESNSATNRARWWRSFVTSNGNFHLYASGNFNSPDGEKDFALAQLTMLYNGASSDIRKNAISLQTGDVSTGSIRGLTLGTTYTGSAGFNGYMHEFIFVDEVSTADRDTLEANQQAYWIP